MFRVETPRFPLLFIAVIICVSHASHALLGLHQAKFSFSFLFLFTCLSVFELKILNKRALGHCLVPQQHVKVQRSSAFQNPRKVSECGLKHTHTYT